MVFWVMYIWVLLVGGYFQSQMSDLVLINDKLYGFRARKSFAILLFSVPVFFIALRTGFVDTSSYIREFNNLPIGMEWFDSTIAAEKDSYLFYGLQFLFKNIVSDNVHVWFAFIAIIQVIAISKTLRRYSCDFAMSVYLFVASSLIISWMCNGMRQFIAVSILFSATMWILEMKWYLYLPLVVILTGIDPFYSWFGWEQPNWFLGGIHQSAIIMIPILFCIGGKAYNARVWIVVAVLSILIVTGNIYLFIGNVAANTTYSGDLSYAMADTGTSLPRVLVSIVPVVLTFVRREYLNNDDVPSIIHLSVNSSIITVMLYIASAVTSGIYVGRLPIYTELYNLILLPWLLKHPYKQERKWMLIVLYVMYTLYFFYQVNVAWKYSVYESRILGIW